MTIERGSRRRVLLVAEAVTLAHFARPVALAQALDTSTYDVHLASDPRYLRLAPAPLPFAFHPIHSIPVAQFTEALARGRAVYGADTLAKYVKEDLALLDVLQPDLVVGDFRLSLAVSAPVAGIPYAAVINAYWSPYARTPYPVPDLPFLRLLPAGTAQRVFDLVRPLAFAMHSLPLNRVRRQYGLPLLGHDLRRVYSSGDFVLYPDLPDAVDMDPLPSTHRFIGPVLWSAQSKPPGWWDAVPMDKPIVYVTLGSSGRSDLLPIVLEALATLPVTVIASSAGNTEMLRPPPNAFVAAFLPGGAATGRSNLVICNGGNLTTYEALAAGIPVIGIAANMDQLLNMQMVERMRAGVAMRAARATSGAIRDLVKATLDDPRILEAARANPVRSSMARSDFGFRQVVGEILGSRSMHEYPAAPQAGCSGVVDVNGSGDSARSVSLH